MLICVQSHDIRTKQSQIAEKQRELTTLEADRKHLREKHREKTRALAQDQEELFDVCETRDYEEVLTEVTNQLVSAQVSFTSCALDALKVRCVKSVLSLLSTFYKRRTIHSNYQTLVKQNLCTN